MFRPRPYDPDRVDTRTEAQKKAGERNFRIFRLRGLYAQMWLLTGWRRKVAWWLVNRELAAFGAKTESQHRAEIMAKWSMK